MSNSSRPLKPPTKQKLLYQQAWLRAMRSEDGLRLTFKTRAGAYEARRHLYEAVRDAKDRPLELPDLFKAAEAIQIVWAGETSLWMRHRDSNDATQGLEAALGMTVEDMADPEAAASQQRMLERLGLGDKLLEELDSSPPVPPAATRQPVSDQQLLGAEHKPNPFYGKRPTLKGDE